LPTTSIESQCRMPSCCCPCNGARLLRRLSIGHAVLPLVEKGPLIPACNCL
jgi:hypothetical protein